MFNRLKYIIFKVSIPAGGTRRDVSSFTINGHVSVTHLFSWVVIGCDFIAELTVIGQSFNPYKTALHVTKYGLVLLLR